MKDGGPAPPLPSLPLLRPSLGSVTSDEPAVMARLINNGPAGKLECELTSVVSGCHAHVYILLTGAVRSDGTAEI